MKPQHKVTTKSHLTINEIRSFQPPRWSEGDIGSLYREASFPITWFLLKTPVTANQITIFWIALGIFGIILLGTGKFVAAIFGGLSLELVIILDCVDGNVARFKSERTLVGRFIDLVGHLTILSLLFIGVAIGIYWEQPQLWIILTGISTTFFLVMGNILYTYREFLIVQNNIPVKKQSKTNTLLQKVAYKSNQLWRTMGLFGAVFVGAATNYLVLVLIIYAITAPLWFVAVLIRIIRELRNYDRLPINIVTSKSWIER